MSPFHPVCMICGVVVGARLSSDLDWAGLPVYDPHQIEKAALEWCNLYRISKLLLVRTSKQSMCSVVGFLRLAS